VADDQSYRARPGYFDPGGAAHMHASLRASDTDREQLVDVLKAAFSEGRLDQDEYTSRMEQAYSAKTYGELRGLVTDLPGPAGPPAQVPYQYTRYPVVKPANSMAVASMVLGLATPLFGLTAIPAVILGHKARRQIRYTGERGNGMAMTGLVIGWAAIGLFVLLVTAGILAAIASTGGTSYTTTPSFGAPNVQTAPFVQPFGGHHHHP
jgi:Domain of unknown function (DUF1707)/Domain of unknown function (DUF4190)